MSDPVQSPSPRPTRVDTWETDLIGGSVTMDLLPRLPPWWKEGWPYWRMPLIEIGSRLRTW